jgi:DNA-directed RNA polymerase beta subunit
MSLSGRPLLFHKMTLKGKLLDTQSVIIVLLCVTVKVAW